jgi:ornithine cyclodeaminase/alanine dehydrogenase-like protein (mu-crystallin family)
MFSTDQLLVECDLIVTTTPWRETLIGAIDNSLLSNKKGLHISCIGADAPGTFELDPKLVGKVGLLVADTAQQSVERGEFQKAVVDGLVGQVSIVSLGNLVNLSELHRKEQGDNCLTIFDSSGVALQDCIVAQ